MEFDITFKPSVEAPPVRVNALDFAQVGLGDISPVRVPGAIKGQKHIPGYFWMSQTKRLVWHESRLELWTLKKIDFFHRVDAVVPQPFVLHYKDTSGKIRRHTPDFLVFLHGGDKLLVNTKLRRYLEVEHNVRSFGACVALSKKLNWHYETECEPDDALRENLNWLSGFRRAPVGLQTHLEALLARLEVKTRFNDLVDGSMGHPALIRPILFHLMWKRIVKFDVGDKVLNSETIVQI